MKLLIGLIAGCATLMGLAAKAEEPLVLLNPYIGGGLGFHQSTFTAGGAVEFAPGAAFFNFGRERDEDWNANITIGLEDLVTVGMVSVRLQADVYRLKSERVTTQLSPVVPVPAFETTTRIDQTFGTNFSVWADLRPLEETPVIMSLGAGAGLANMRMFVTDNQPNTFFGTVNKTQLTFMIGAQIGYEFSDAVTAGVEARYIDFGEFNVNMFRASDNSFTGRFNLDLTTRMVMGFVRFDLNAL